MLPWCYRGTTAVASRKRQETRPRRPPHGAHAARAPTKQQGHETPHCTARPRSPMSRSKTVYMKSAAPIPDAMKLLWEVLRRWPLGVNAGLQGELESCVVPPAESATADKMVAVLLHYIWLFGPDSMDCPSPDLEVLQRENATKTCLFPSWIWWAPLGQFLNFVSVSRVNVATSSARIYLQILATLLPMQFGKDFTQICAVKNQYWGWNRLE